ncbi:MAG: DinB family protein, partial [Pseudomonadota bacterium]
EAAGGLGTTDYHADLGAAFRSVSGTLNHLLVTDRIWLARLEGEPAPALSLDQTLHDAHEPLREARAETDAALIALVDGLDQGALQGTNGYRRVSAPELIRQPRAEALAHLFNHQTHHRGQTHALLQRLTGAAPALDLLFFQRETNLAKG